jgi:cytochrome c oxidase subunit 4
MSEPAVKPPTYLLIYGVLIALALGTTGVAFLPLGGWHTVAAMVIASTKAILVLLFFMHLLHSPKLTWVVVAAAVFFLGIMLTLTFADYMTRHWLSY